MRRMPNAAVAGLFGGGYFAGPAEAAAAVAQYRADLAARGWDCERIDAAAAARYGAELRILGLDEVGTESLFTD